jgi:hypothetical protein
MPYKKCIAKQEICHGKPSTGSFFTFPKRGKDITGSISCNIKNNFDLRTIHRPHYCYHRHSITYSRDKKEDETI